MIYFVERLAEECTLTVIITTQSTLLPAQHELWERSKFVNPDCGDTTPSRGIIHVLLLYRSGDTQQESLGQSD